MEGTSAVVDRVEEGGGCAVESGAEVVGGLDEEAVGRSLAIGEAVLSLLSSAKARRWSCCWRVQTSAKHLDSASDACLELLPASLWYS